MVVRGPSLKTVKLYKIGCLQLCLGSHRKILHLTKRQISEGNTFLSNHLPTAFERNAVVMYTVGGIMRRRGGVRSQQKQTVAPLIFPENYQRIANLFQQWVFMEERTSISTLL